MTGVDEQGRSCVVEERDLGTIDDDDMVRHKVFTTTESPPRPRPEGVAPVRDLGVAPGLAYWAVVHWPPGHEELMHHTDTVDYDIVLAGTIDLILDDGTHHLGVGDCVVVAGVDHAWKAGPDGCTLSAMLVGSSPRP